MSRAGTTTSDRTRGASSTRTTTRTTTRTATRTARAGRPERLRKPRQWMLRRGRRHPLLVAALIPLMLATVAWVLWESPLLAVRSVQVDGVRTLTAAEVRDAAGLTTGTPLLKVDVAGASARVRRLPQVASAQVARGWPDRVVVTVTERVPVAVVDRSGQRTLVDASGVLFDTVTGDPPQGVVALQVAHPGPADAATRAGLAAIVALPPAVRTDVRAVSATAAEDVVLHLNDDTTVLWGDGGQAAAKASALAALRHQIHQGALKGAATIDVSSPRDVVLR